MFVESVDGEWQLSPYMVLSQRAQLSLITAAAAWAPVGGVGGLLASGFGAKRGGLRF